MNNRNFDYSRLFEILSFREFVSVNFDYSWSTEDFSRIQIRFIDTIQSNKAPQLLAKVVFVSGEIDVEENWKYFHLRGSKRTS